MESVNTRDDETEESRSGLKKKLVHTLGSFALGAALLIPPVVGFVYLNHELKSYQYQNLAILDRVKLGGLTSGILATTFVFGSIGLSYVMRSVVYTAEIFKIDYRTENFILSCKQIFLK